MSEDKEIRKLRDEIEQLKKFAYKDELTGLLTRRGFAEGTDGFLSELSWVKEQSEKRESVVIKNFSIILFDIDDFKKLNDTFGHQAGDAVLVRLAEILEENVRDIDLPARWGGEELVLGLVGANENDAYKIAERVRGQTEGEKLQFDGKDIRFTVSGGVASFEEVKDFEELFSLADKALYKAKKEGKNKVVRHSSIK